MMNDKSTGSSHSISWHNRFWGALYLIVVYYLIPAVTRDLWSPDEIRYAEISREMIAAGDWIVPRLLSLRYFEKPVGGYWFNNISQWLWGSSALAVRGSSLISTFLTCLIIFRCAGRLGLSSTYRWFSVYVYASMLLVCAVGSYSILDPQLALWLSVVLWSGCEQLSAQQVQGYRFFILMGIGMGMACLTKGFLGLVLPGVAIGPLLLTHRYRERFRATQLLVALLVAILLVLPWALCIHAREPDYWNYFFWKEHVHRFLSQQAEHVAPIWFFLPVLALGAMPWTPLLIGTIWRPIRTWDQQKKSISLVEGYLFSWFISPLIFFSVCKGKLLTYSLPLFSPIVLLMTSYWASLAEAQKVKWRGRLAFTNILFALVLLGLAIWKREWLDHSNCFTDDFAIDRRLLYIWCAIGIGWLLPNMVLYGWRHRRVEWLAVGSLSIGTLFAEAAIPDWVKLYKQPTKFLHEHRRVIQSADLWICNDPNLSVALGWYTRNTQIYLMGSSVGELRYGLSYPDARFKSLDWQALTTLRMKKAKKCIVYWIHGEEACHIFRQLLPQAELVAHKGRLWLFRTT